jgi:hypothetical protein
LPLLNVAREDIYRRLDLDFYDPRLSTLTPAEQDLLLSSAICDYPPLIVSDLNEASDKSPKNVNVLLGRLVESGVLYRVRKAQYEYTAPKFRDYLIRRISSSQPLPRQAVKAVRAAARQQDQSLFDPDEVE